LPRLSRNYIQNSIFSQRRSLVFPETTCPGCSETISRNPLSAVRRHIREFAKWILIANIIAWPFAYFAANKWLQNFAYRVNLSVWIFILSGLVVLSIALLTVSYQSIKAATANPVDSLKYE